jgi:3-hydroxyisobutyrate dehydrogenase-like beta-hydroxyacid dehydrogenase
MSETQTAYPAVSFIGLGKMGLPMAANALRHFPGRVSVYNRTALDAPRRAQLVGARWATSPRDCARGASVIVTMVSDAAALSSVLGIDDHVEGRNDGVLAGLEAGALVVDMSTIGRAGALAAARAVEARGGRFVDAPVSGSVKPAQRGELVALVGGDADDIARAEPVLLAMCKRILVAGGVGQGQALKVVLNGVGSHHLVAFTSMLALGERAGLARETIVDAFTSGAFASPSYVGKASKVVRRDFTPEFSLALTKKDTQLNIELQDELEMPLAVHRAIAREVDLGIDEGLGDEDLFALEKHFARAAAPPRAR